MSIVTNIQKLQFSQVRTFHHFDLLEQPVGPRIRMMGYIRAFDARSDRLRVPWDPNSWNRFWFYYVRTVKDYLDLPAGVGWSKVIPLSFDHRLAFGGPPGTAVDIQCWLYSHAVTVITTVSMTGAWPIKDVADVVSESSQLSGYSVSHGLSNRNLYGLASDVYRAAMEEFAAGVDPGPPTEDGPVSVTSAVLSDGVLPDLDDDNADVRRIIAGLAYLGPPGDFDENRLLQKNRNSNRAARVYAAIDGHVIWHPGEMISSTASRRLECLFANQVAGVAHVQSIGGLVGWAARRASAGGVVHPDAHDLLAAALCNLGRLHEGRQDRTYSSGILQARTSSFLNDIRTVSERVVSPVCDFTLVDQANASPIPA